MTSIPNVEKLDVLVKRVIFSVLKWKMAQVYAKLIFVFLPSRAKVLWHYFCYGMYRYLPTGNCACNTFKKYCNQTQLIRPTILKIILL